MKKLLIILFMCFVPIGIHAQTQPTDTDGDGYYNISTLDHLRWVAENAQSWSWNFELDNDIDASDTKNWNSGKGWEPIGKYNSRPYEGIFDGHGYKIINLYINRPVSSYIGFFGYIYKAKISNIGISNCNVIGDHDVGGLCGQSYGSSISYSYSTGSVSSYRGNTGGFCGLSYGGRISHSYSTVQVLGNGDDVGGFLGRDYEYKGIFSGNFWDIQTSGIDSSVAGKGKTTIEMKTKSTFTNVPWCFRKIWDINPDVNNGYPFLREVFSSVEEDDVPTDELLIYPNPTYDFITIDNHLAPNCQVYDINGRLVLEFQSNTADVSGLPKGTYFVIVKDNGKSYYQRFVKDY